MVDVPLHIVNPPAIRQNVRVEGGTNWDVSRAAVPTPVVELPDPEPVVTWVHEAEKPAPALPGYSAKDGIPAAIPTVYQFASGTSVVAKDEQQLLKALDKAVKYVVVGHAAMPEASPSKLAWARANNVAAVLRRSGHKVSVVKAFGNERPRSYTNSANQRVEVYAAGNVK